MGNLTRRRFLTRSAATAAVLTIAGSSRVLGANERINVGLIGAGDRGRGLWAQFLAQPEVSAVAVCDVYQPNLDQAAAMVKTQVAKQGDFRRVLDEKGLDAVIVEDPKQLQCEAQKDPGSEQGESHVRNFLDCVKSRARPNADVEEGHLSAVMCHLGNIALRTGKLLEWDAEREQIVGDTAANAWLKYEYRKPWSLES